MPDPNAEASAKGIDHFEIARPCQNIWQEWPHANTAQCVSQIGSDQCGGACLIQIWGPDPSAEGSAE
jgi:L-rhamnose isomerase